MCNKDEIFKYLLELQLSGETNMLGAGVYLERDFNMKSNEAKRWLGDWIQSFSKPNCENCE